MSQELLRAIFLVGFVLQILLGVWAIVTVTRMRREQQVALAILNHLAARAGLQRESDRIELGGMPTAARDERNITPAPVPGDPRERRKP